MKHVTIIFSNAGDQDCQTLRKLWAGISQVKMNLIEVTIHDSMWDFVPEINEALRKEDDTVIFCGHGTTSGLLSPRMDGYLFCEHNFKNLKAKNVLAIWCNANGFWNKVNYPVLTSSMYISNVGEANWCNVKAKDQEFINNTNEATFTEMNKLLLEGVEFNQWTDILMETLDTTNHIDTYNRKGMMYLKG